MAPLRLFYSYAPRDEPLREALEAHLSLLQRQGLIEGWHQRLALPGSEPAAEVDAHLMQADIILPLLSADFLASDYCYGVEMRRALERHHRGEARVVPVLVRPVDLAGAPFADLPCLPAADRSVGTWANQDQAWREVARGIRQVVEELRGRAPGPLDPGTVLAGRYRIIEEIGRGGMGRVLLAERLGIGGKAAIKVLLPELSRDAEMARRFYNEARAVNDVAHPGLVQVFDHGQLGDGATYLVMEYLHGESLGMRLRRDPLGMRAAAARVGFQLAAILAAVHERGIVHRDLKPDNVLMVRDSSVAGGERARVLDFGIAKVARENSLAAGTQAGDVLGTPQYMSPEQCLDSARVTERADVYALGVMLYQMLAGRLPFNDRDPMVVMNLQVNQPLPPLGGLAPEADRRLVDLVERMLEKDPQGRPAMAQAGAALEALLAAGPTPGPARRPVLIAAFAGALAVGGLGLLGWRLSLAGPTREPAKDMRPVRQASPDLRPAEPTRPTYELRWGDGRQERPPGGGVLGKGKVQGKGATHLD